MQLQNKLFIASEFVDAEARGRIEVLNPHDNSKIADVAEARQADIDTAGAAAGGASETGPPRSNRGPKSWRTSNRSTPAIRSATPGCSTCRAPPRPSATS